MIAFQGRRIDPAKPVEVYRNLHLRGTWYSIRQDGLVVAHATTVRLTDVTFHVSEPGRQRVLLTGRKNVHATVRGWILVGHPVEPAKVVTYNPRKMRTFITLPDLAPITSADWAVIDGTGIGVGWGPPLPRKYDFPLHTAPA